MSDLPHPWDEYHRLQQQLDRSTNVNHQTWGLEAALDEVLTAVETSTTITTEAIGRAMASAARLERYRAALLEKMLKPLDPNDGVVDQTSDARETLEVLVMAVLPEDLDLLVAVGEGRPYAELAFEMGASPGALRTRVSRLRRSLK